MKVALVNDEYPSGQLMTSVLAILNSVELCSMATARPSGECHIHAAYFCFNDHLDLYSVSDVSAIHSQNLTYSNSMAVAVFDTTQPWSEPHRGLQLFGKARQAGLLESAKALAVHARRFHAYGDYIKALSPSEREASSYKFYVFEPDMIKIFDEPTFGEEKFILARVARH